MRVIYPPAGAGYFLASAQRMGAKLLYGKRAIEAAQGMVVLEDSTRLSARHIVIATGTDVSLCPSLTVNRRKGHLAITDRYPGVLHHQLVELGYLKSAHSMTEDSVAFNVQPRKTGQLLIGSSRQYGDLSAQAEPRILRKMLDRALEYMPMLAGLSVIRVWTGFRAATPDKLPLIGPTEDSSVLLAMGFEGLGITNAPGAARLILHHITQSGDRARSATISSQSCGCAGGITCLMVNGGRATVTVQVNGQPVMLPNGAMLIAALLNSGVPCRISEAGEQRTALCGMGICFECRASVDGVPQQRTCQIVCREGMKVETQR